MNFKENLKLKQKEKFSNKNLTLTKKIIPEAEINNEKNINNKFGTKISNNILQNIFGKKLQQENISKANKAIFKSFDNKEE